MSSAVGHGWHAGQGFSVDLELEQDDLDLVLQAYVGGHLVDHVVGTFLRSEHGIPAIASSLLQIVSQRKRVGKSVEPKMESNFFKAIASLNKGQVSSITHVTFF